MNRQLEATAASDSTTATNQNTKCLHAFTRVATAISISGIDPTQKVRSGIRDQGWRWLWGLAASALFFAQISQPARAQDNYEIQVYPSETTPRGDHDD